MLGTLLMKNNLSVVRWSMKNFESLHIVLDYSDNKMKQSFFDLYARQHTIKPFNSDSCTHLIEIHYNSM